MISLDYLKITPEFLKRIAEIDSFKGGWQKTVLPQEQLKTLQRFATIESVGASNRIEGNSLSDAVVAELFDNISPDSFKSRDEEDVMGYVELLKTIYDNYQTIPLSENYIKQFHQILLRYTNERYAGAYKTQDNRVVAIDAEGKEIGNIFEPASPFDTPRLMQELVDWTNRNLQESFYHPILVIGVFVVNFLAIHPFIDGNGRLSRVLTNFLLLKMGYGYIPYASMESFIESSKDRYYFSLYATQKTIWTEHVNYEPWLAYFIEILYKQVNQLTEKIKS